MSGPISAAGLLFERNDMVCIIKYKSMNRMIVINLALISFFIFVGYLIPDIKENKESLVMIVNRTDGDTLVSEKDLTEDEQQALQSIIDEFDLSYLGDRAVEHIVNRLGPDNYFDLRTTRKVDRDLEKLLKYAKKAYEDIAIGEGP